MKHQATRRTYPICLLCCLLFAVHVEAGQNSNAAISLDYVASGPGNRIDDSVTSATVSGRGTTIVVEVFARNVSTPLSAVEIRFKSSSVLSYVRAENPNTSLPVNLANGIALTFTNPLTPSANGNVFLAKVEFTTRVDVSNSAFKIGIEKVKLAENSNNFDDITSSNEIVFNRSSTTTNSFQIVWPMDGDINYDGQVDTPDYLLLVNNFGKTGAVPTSRMAIENALGGSGTVVTIRDTIYRTVRDTIYQTRSGSPQEERAKKMLGFWQFKGGFFSTQSYILGHTEPEELTSDDGEIYFFGSSNSGVIVGGVYLQDRGKYTLLHESIFLNYFYVFDIQGDRAIGELYLFSSNESIDDASRYTLSSISGRTRGTGFTNYSNKPAIRHLEPNDQRKKIIVPPDVIDAYNRTKAMLDAQKIQ